MCIYVYYIAIQCNSRHASIVGTCFVLDDCSLCATLSFRHSDFFRSFGQSPPRFQFHSKPGCSDFKAVCMSLDLLQKIVFVVEIWENRFASSLTIKGWTESTDVLWYFQIFVFYIGGLMFSIVLCDFVMYSWDVRAPGIPKKSSVQLILWRSQQRRRPRQSHTPLQRRCITL